MFFTLLKITNIFLQQLVSIHLTIQTFISHMNRDVGTCVLCFFLVISVLWSCFRHRAAGLSIRMLEFRGPPGRPAFISSVNESHMGWVSTRQCICPLPPLCPIYSASLLWTKCKLKMHWMFRMTFQELFTQGESWFYFWRFHSGFS